MIPALMPVIDGVGVDVGVALVTSLLVVLLLIQREIIAAAGNFDRLASYVLIAIPPLLGVFTLIVSSRLLSFLW